MAYQVKPLSPALSQTFVDYLGALDFHHAPPLVHVLLPVLLYRLQPGGLAKPNRRAKRQGSIGADTVRANERLSGF